nr:radical SAM family heme chaperone HemW [Lachnospiraceae bacterium]
MRGNLEVFDDLRIRFPYGMMDMDNVKKRELGIYVHIPFCKSKCVYCDFLSFGGFGYSEHRAYADTVCREIAAWQAVSEAYVVTSIFLGGGTPSYVKEELIVRVLEQIHSVFEVEKDAEITIEGNPDSLKPDNLKAYRKSGINRLSIGLQSANDKVLASLNRVHNYDQFTEAFYSARQSGFDNINVDIMSGLPGEGEKSYMETLKRAAGLSPEHISAYSLIVENGTPLSANHALLNLLPSEEEDREMYTKTKRLLENSGYSRYEISNYARDGFECRHNIGYWTGREYLGVGLGASSYLKVYTENEECKALRFKGIDNLDMYIEGFSGCGGMNDLLSFIADYYSDLYILK